MLLEVGDYHNESGSNQFNILTQPNDSNPMYTFFKTARGPLGEGIIFNSTNVKDFAPAIRLYAFVLCFQCKCT